MKKVIAFLLTIGCMLGIILFPFDSFANDNYVSIYIDCGGLNSVKTSDGHDLIWGEDRAVIGSTVSSVWNMTEDPTSVDQDFIGWYVYDKASGAQVSGTGLLTTAQVNNYVIPNYKIKFVAQWTPRAGYPVNNITYAHFWNGEGEPCYDIKMSIIYGDTVYSGDGFVSIPESIYSTWIGNITYRIEPRNGAYTMYDGKWTNQVCEYEGTVKEFVKQKSVYCSANTTGKGADVTSPRRKVNDWYYQMSFVPPVISKLNETTADQVISDNTVVPPTYTVATEVFESGASYDAALNAAQTAHGTNNVFVVDITVKDDSGANVTQLTDYVDVRVDIPATYTIQPGNTVVVYFLNDNGILEECETVYHDEDSNNRYVTFKTNHFSVYVLVEKSPVAEDKEESVAEKESEEVPQDTSTEKGVQTEEAGTNEKEAEETMVGDDKEENTEEEEIGQGESVTYEPETEDLDKDNDENQLIGMKEVIIGCIIVVIISIFVAVLFYRKKK